MALEYFFDGQIRSYLTQCVCMLSGFQYMNGTDKNGNPTYRVVPVTMASRDKQVGSIINNNSENAILSTPQISVFIANVAMDSQRRQAPNHISTVPVLERKIDKTSNKYTTEMGLSYSVERFMPVPYKITIQADIWTSNEFQKHQIMEQIMVLFNPGIDIQTSTNPIDWTALTNIEMTDINWSSRGIPIGTDSTALEISSLTFNLPVWINPPAKVTKQRIIEQIITNITEIASMEKSPLDTDPDSVAIDWSRGDPFSRVIVTPGDHHISLDGNIITLLGSNGSEVDENGDPWDFIKLFKLYHHQGVYRPGISQIRLKMTDDMDDHETDVVGTIHVDESNPNQAEFIADLNTLPPNTLPSIKGIINPRKTYPGNNLPVFVAGNRLLLLDSISVGTVWGNILANRNDIIELQSDGTWVVVFNSLIQKNDETLVNVTSGKQLSWKNGEWVMTLEGEYRQGYWRIAL